MGWRGVGGRIESAGAARKLGCSRHGEIERRKQGEDRRAKAESASDHDGVGDVLVSNVDPKNLIMD